MNSRIRSRDLSDYLRIDASAIRVDSPIPFDLYLHFERNGHIVIWRTEGDVIDAAALQKLTQNGRSHLWIHRDQEAELRAYQQTSSAPTLSDTVSESPKNVDSEDPAVELAFAISAPGDLDPEIVGQAARQALVQSEPPALRDAIRGLLDSIDEKSRAIALQIWSLSESDPHLIHGINVATYATLLSLAFGKIDRSVLADIALAGLLHDLGIADLSDSDFPSSHATDAMSPAYAAHVSLTLELLGSIDGAEIPERVLRLIEQHHERFDGKGYPNRRTGFQFDDLAQLLAMGELLEELCSGEWDGRIRTKTEALSELARLDGDASAPRFFNPELLRTIHAWLPSPEASSSAPQALGIVQGRVTHLLNSQKLD